MKRRNNKKMINTLKCVRDQTDIHPILKFFKGSYWHLAKYLEELQKKNLCSYDVSVLALTRRGEEFLEKCK